MIEKITHIKNPLTVIAIFAGLAEVSGTVVLPFLQKDAQHVYVWFLMGFPLLLVILFFVTLFLRHYVLYAPSDFKEDRSFTDLLERPSATLRSEQLKEEAGEIEAVATPEEDAGQPTIHAKDILKRDARATALLAEELVLAKLSRELGVRFDRDIAAKNRKVVFDAVATSENRMIAVEVKFTRQAFFPRDLLLRTFDRIGSFVSSLPEKLRANFELILAVTTDSADQGRVDRLRHIFKEVADGYTFKTSVRVYNLSELESEFDIK
jgi:hypothetical protein